MDYRTVFKPQALKDLGAVPRKEGRRILGRMEELEHDLAGDVKRLASHRPEYRLRVGNYRVLFELEGDQIVVYRILHRKEAYR
ncbi:MAG: type II toxin-antitoxin system RelE/ParE family toxin [Thermodesulfobacteriota bacterium]